MRGIGSWSVVAALAVAAMLGAATGAAAQGAAAGTVDVEIVIEPSEQDAAAETGSEAVAKQAGAPSGESAAGAVAKAKGKGAAGQAGAAKAGAAGKGAAEEPGERVARMQTTFAEFCRGWIDKLRERERHNLAQVKWEALGDGVVAEYVGYDTNNVGPQSVHHVESTPIGKLVYLEYKLRRAGKSKEEALSHEPEVVERTEVTEIFRFDRGSWVY